MREEATRGVRAVMQFAAEPDSVAAARHFVRESLKGHPRFLVDTAALLASELVTNAVVHGGTAVDVGISDDDDVLRIAVTDQNPQMPVLRRVGEGQVSGRGLAIVDELADRWSVTELDSGKTVWFVIDIRAGRFAHF
jgi:sigma-B regulation protein RsbU (phosphoserine phosphatase)